MDIKQKFIEGVNEWVASLKDNIVKGEEKKKTVNHCVVIAKKIVKTKIDNISVRIRIFYQLGFDSEREFSISIEDELIFWDIGNNCGFLIGEDENVFINTKTVEELYEKIVELKNYKYCNITGNFVKELSSNKMMEALDVILDNEKKECSVCLSTVGDSQKLKCCHFLCHHCRHEMLRKKNKKCPLCRDENLDEDGDNSDEEDDE
jgi:hypothetical protein